MKKNVIVLRNRSAGRADARGAHDAALGKLETVELAPDADAAAAARQAIARGAEVVVAVGGDGTVSRVADALIGTDAALAIVPAGTGNDLARSLALPTDASEALALIDSGAVRAIDVVRACPDDGPPTYVVNVAAGGLSGQVDEALGSEDKQRWGPLAYLWTAVKVLPDLRPYRAELTFDDEPPVVIDAINVVVANGRTVAGGWAVAPTAELDDGLADVVVVRHARALDLAGVAARLATGDALGSPAVAHRRVRRVRIRSQPGMPFNVDGELVTRTGCTFDVIPRALRVVVPAPRGSM